MMGKGSWRKIMYAVIRAGGKQYRVAPGDIVRLEKLAANQGDTVEFNDVLAISSEDGKIGPGSDAVVSGQVMDTGRGDKILVFHFKRKKQYKKIYGHRQPYTQVRITEIAFDGQRFTAPELPPPRKKAAPAPAEPEESMAEEASAEKPAAKATARKKAAPRKAAPRKAAKKGPAKKSKGKPKKKGK
jgi:large subunit ribosomal protein L21